MISWMLLSFLNAVMSTVKPDELSVPSKKAPSKFIPQGLCIPDGATKRLVKVHKDLVGKDFGGRVAYRPIVPIVGKLEIPPKIIAMQQNPCIVNSNIETASVLNSESKPVDKTPSKIEPAGEILNSESKPVEKTPSKIEPASVLNSESKPVEKTPSKIEPAGEILNSEYKPVEAAKDSIENNISKSNGSNGTEESNKGNHLDVKNLNFEPVKKLEHSNDQQPKNIEKTKGFFTTSNIVICAVVIVLIVVAIICALYFIKI